MSAYTLGNILVESAAIGGVLFVGDLLLRPNIGTPVGNLLRGTVLSVGVVWTYNSISATALKPNTKTALEVFAAFLGITLSDLAIRPMIVAGAGAELIEYYIQGLIVTSMLYFVNKKENAELEATAAALAAGQNTSALRINGSLY